MDESIKISLEEAGLDTEEQSIYLYALQHGPVTQQKLAESTGLLRQTIYDRIRRLESKGVISRINEAGRPLFNAVPPAILLEQSQQKAERLKKVIPWLETLQGESSFHTSSVTFSGLNALKKLMLLTLSTKKEILWLSNKKINDEVFASHFWHNYAARRIEKKIPIKLLIEPTSDNDWKTSVKDKRFTRTHKFVKNQESAIVIFDDQVIIYTVTKGTHYGLHINDSSLSKLFKKFFELLWEEGKQI
jgi:sugar-specific transcriptional regulator TrmB